MAEIAIAGTDTRYGCDDDTVMRAALRAGLGFPYECNVGSCGNCRFELLEGEVAHDREAPPAWTERDRQRNRYLGCQARPRGDCRIKVGLHDQYRSLYRPQRSAAKLIAIHELTHDMREFRFRLAQPSRFLPGQYGLISLDGVAGGRAYSMCNVRADGAEWHFIIKRVAGGAATGQLFEAVVAGGMVEIDGPYGMAYLREDAPRDILCLAGGSGLSPMISIVRAAAVSPALADRAIHFVYGGRTARDICGEATIRALPGFGSRLHYHPCTSMPESGAGAAWDGRRGFVHEVADALFGERLGEFEIYFAGPPAMAVALRKMLFEMKVSPTQIHFDEFY